MITSSYKRPISSYLVPRDNVLENGDLQPVNRGNAYFHQQTDKTLPLEQQRLKVRINQPENIRLMPSAVTQESWNNGETLKQNYPTNQPSTGHYCRLSYYGEEVDKEFLPETPSIVHGNYSYVHHQQQHPPAPAPHWNKGAGHFNPSHLGKRTFRYPHPQQQQHFTTNPVMPRNVGQVNEWKAHNDAANVFRQPETIIDHNHRSSAQPDIHNNLNVLTVSASEGVSNIQTAASCFQERQAKQNAGIAPTALQGWSRVTSTATVKRKVILHNDDNHETKLKKRSNRFGEPVEFNSRNRRHSGEVSLEEIIARKKIKTQLGRDVPISGHRYVSSSTWMSGDGKNVNVNGSPRHYDCFHNGCGYGVDFRYERRSRPYSRGRRQNGNWKLHTAIDDSGAILSEMERKSLQKERESTRAKRFKPVVIDGANLAFTYGEDLHFACEGIRICVDYFLQLGCDKVTVVVPKDRLKRGASKDVEILQDLKQRNMLLVNWDGQFASDGKNSDDRLFILDAARIKDAIIVSNSRFTDVARYNPGLRPSVWNRVLNFQFNAAKEILFPDIDPSGMYGHTWEDVLQY